MLLLDEPFAAVDRPVRRRLQDEIDGLRRTLDIPLILVTHDFDDVVRLATHVLILERGHERRLRAGDDADEPPGLRGCARPWGWARVRAVVVRDRPIAGSSSWRSTAARCSRPIATSPTGTTVRVRIPAREVILATQAPEGLSLHNVLCGRVSAIHTDPAFDHVIVQVAVGRVLLLAEVTQDAIDGWELPSACRSTR